jgi:hypothetical protein
MLVPFHAAIIFDTNPSAIFQIQKQSPIAGIDYFIDFVAQWGMPILFVFAGMGVWFALLKRSPKQFLNERWKRLGIPLIFGLLVLIPPLVYFLQVELFATSPSFGQFYIQFFTSGISDFSGFDGKWTPGPLWFILFLLLYSLIALPFFRLIRNHALKFQDPPNQTPKRSQFISILVIPSILMILASLVPGFGDKNIVYYAIFFVIGFLFASNPSSQIVIDKLGYLSLFLAFGSHIIKLVIFSGVYSPWTVNWILSGFIYYFGNWFWILAIMGLGHRFIHNNGKILQYCSEMSYPFYILHATVLGIVAYLIFQFPLDSITMYLLIIVFTYAGIFVIYHFLIRKTRVGRILFGMKPKKMVESN